MKITRQSACLDTYQAHYRDRSMFQREYVRRLLAEPQIRGEVLDIGCGSGLPEALSPLNDVLAAVDGVDPSPDVMKHPRLRRRWQDAFETCDAPANTYDLAFAYNVVEHVVAPKPFFEKLRRVLKPGGVFWALTPRVVHPFATCVRLIEFLGLKHWISSRSTGINDYPAYYRLNSSQVVARVARQCGFESAEFVYIPCMQWEGYLPRPLRFIANLYDGALGLRFQPCMQLLAYRLQ